jgi:hypothetical protein
MRVVGCRPKLTLQREEIVCVVQYALPTSNYNFDTHRTTVCVNGCLAKLTAISYRRLLTALCRAPSFAECLVLSKDIFAECISVPRVKLSVTAIIT